MSETPLTREMVLAVLLPRFSEPGLAQAWFETKPVPGFGSATAEQLVDASRGSEVLDYIAAVDAGIFA